MTADRVVCVPYRSGEPHRELNWWRVRTRWEQWGFTVFAVDSPGDWKMARARNVAAALAGDWNVAIFADADILLETREQAEEALWIARETGSYTACYTTLCYHDEHDEVYHRATSWICAFAIRRDLWDMLGGFDERFPGNDGEDIAFFHAARTLGPEPQRAAGDAHHLWHPPRHDRIIGGELALRYKQARDDQDAMRAVLAR